MHTHTAITAFAVAAATALTASVGAATLYDQPFDYGPAVLDFGSDLAGDGWTDSTGLITYDPDAGLTYAGHVGNTGGAWQMDHTALVTRTADQNVADIDLATTAGQESYFFALGRATDSTNAMSMVFQSNGAVNDVTFTLSGGEISATVFGPGVSAVTSGTEAVNDGETFAILVKATQSVSASPVDTTMEVWLNPDLANLGTADFTTLSKFGRHGASQAFSGVDFDGTAGPDLYWDEVIWTTDFSDITGTVIPEPASVMLLATGGLFVLGRRRRA